MTTRAILTIGLLAILAGCISLAMLVSQFSGAAVDKALSETPDSAQKVTAVCVGLNIGSCRTSQESTSKRATGDGNPWPSVALATAVIAPLVLWGMFTWSKPNGWED